MFGAVFFFFLIERFQCQFLFIFSGLMTFAAIPGSFPHPLFPIFLTRMKQISKIIESKDPDIVCFQEVTPKIHENFLLWADWTQKYHVCAVAPEPTVLPYGTVIYTKLPVKNFVVFEWPTGMARRFLCTALRVNNETIGLGTVHLESLSSRPTRKKQVTIATNVFEDLPNAMIMGDFNHHGDGNERKDNFSCRVARRLAGCLSGCWEISGVYDARNGSFSSCAV
jgi:hypothetical protein